MSFRDTLTEYENDLFLALRNSNPDRKYNPEKIRGLLISPTNYQKYCGIKLLEPHDKKNIERIYKMADEGREIIRYAVVSKLAGIGGRRSIKILLRALNDDSRHVREKSIRSLLTIGDTSIIDELYPLLSDKWHNVRLEAARTLCFLEDFQHKEAETRYLLDDELPIRHILNLLSDKSKWNRLAAIDILAEQLKGRQFLKNFCGLHAVGPLQKTSRNDDAEEVRQEAGELAKSLLDRGVLNNIWHEIKSENNSCKVISLASSLMDIDNKQATNILHDMLIHEFWLENHEICIEEDEEIRDLVADYFMKRYKNSGDRSELELLFSALLYARNDILTESLVLTLSTSGAGGVYEYASSLLVEEISEEATSKLFT